MSHIAILNVGAGDTKLTFDLKKPAERKHAARVVKDMLKRGYAILVEAGQDKDGEPLYRRAKAFDEKTCEYIIVGIPEDSHEEATTKTTARKTPKSRRPAERRISAASAPAVAVSRSAGG